MVRRREGVEELREIGGELALVHGGRVVSLNRTGTYIWDLLAEPRTLDELQRVFSAAYHERSAGDDVQQFVLALDGLGLLEHG